MNDELGVLDETYAALFDTFLSGAVEAAAFRSQFYATVTSDARLGDDVRYAILQRVFFGLEDLVLDGDLPDGEERDHDEIDEAAFREILAKAARDLKHRPDGWEGSNGQIQGAGGPGGSDLPDGSKEATHGS
ncbi:hypothetical protein [Janibacter indicus]|uniref:Colicin D immunity protein domain-containing protein n=1 Tax=Janibacter indicus TaxID=857417 RepID=A0A1W2CE93_9MICO|nr:hypothetical protein [Janibacter indicus]SMC83597.1 hypothetical protein SAMN06296429_11128 [Janibacter indicus]